MRDTSPGALMRLAATIAILAAPAAGCDGGEAADAGPEPAIDGGGGSDAGGSDGGSSNDRDAGASGDAGDRDAGDRDAGGGGFDWTACSFSETTARIELVTAPEPGYLRARTDPVFGTRVIRVTGDPGSAIGSLAGTWQDVSRHGYSKRQPWNADGTLVFLAREVPVFLDGRTFEPALSGAAPTSMNESRWHPTRPDIRIFVGDTSIGEWNVRTGTTTTLATFAGYDALHMGPWEGNLSNDGDHVALLGRSSTGRQVAFAYDLSTRSKGPDIDLEGVPVDWVSISPLGTYVVVNGWNDETQVYRASDGTVVGGRWTEYGRPSHYDLAVNLAGEEVAVGVSKSDPDDGRVIARRLADGAVTVLTPGGYATHTSTRNLGRPGWAYVTYNYRGESWLPYRDEIVAVPLDGSMRVQRLAHLHSQSSDYLGESHGVPSPDGRFVLFASNWDGGARPIRGYVIDVGPVCGE